nr:sporulation protein RMD1 [Tanacetum cinerariifolium]
MDPNTPNNTVDNYDIYFQDDAERYMRGYEAYEQFLAMSNQEAEGANNDLNVLYGSPLFEDVLADTASNAQFVVNERTYKNGYYLADDIYSTWVPGANNDLNVLYGSPLFEDVLADTASEAPFVVNERTYKKARMHTRLLSHSSSSQTASVTVTDAIECHVPDTCDGSIPVRAYFFSTSMDLKSLLDQNRINFIPATNVVFQGSGASISGSDCRYMVVFQYGSIVLFNVRDHEIDGYLKIVERHASGLLPEMRKDGEGSGASISGSDCRYMVVFQYGSIVLFNVRDHEIDGYLKIVERHASGLLPEMRKDEYEVKEKPTLDTWMQGGLDSITLQYLNIDGIRTIGSVLGQSIALDYYVRQVDGMVGEFTDINRGMEKTGTFTMKRKKLFQLVGKANSNLADVILKLGLFESTYESGTVLQNAQFIFPHMASSSAIVVTCSGIQFAAVDGEQDVPLHTIPELFSFLCSSLITLESVSNLSDSTFEIFVSDNKEFCSKIPDARMGKKTDLVYTGIKIETKNSTYESGTVLQNAQFIFPHMASSSAIVVTCSGIQFA